MISGERHEYPSDFKQNRSAIYLDRALGRMIDLYNPELLAVAKERIIDRLRVSELKKHDERGK